MLRPQVGKHLNRSKVALAETLMAWDISFALYVFSFQLVKKFLRLLLRLTL